MRRTFISVVLAIAASQPAVLRADEPAAPAARALVRHIPPSEVEASTALRLVAQVDDAWTETSLLVRYRQAGGQGVFAEIPFERSSTGGYYATIPAADLRRPGVEYFIVGVLADGREVAHFASERWPHEVRIEPAASQRWIEAERARLAGRDARVRAWVEGMRFGNVDGADHFFRGEIDWTSRLVTTLYSFTLGYGFIEGQTPVSRDADAMDPSVTHAARYGFAEVRLRLHRSVWLDGGVTMGVSHDGFATGIRGKAVLGKEWRSCVIVGGEFMQDMGSRVWLTLQWDTVPPFLMAATVSDTGFPESNIGRGSSVSFDVTFPVSHRIGVTAQVSYASRSERPGSLGGGLGTSFEF